MTFHVYRDTAGQWRWRLVAKNGRTVGDSGEGYRRRVDCVRMAQRILLGAPYLSLVVDEK